MSGDPVSEKPSVGSAGVRVESKDHEKHGDAWMSWMDVMEAQIKLTRWFAGSQVRRFGRYAVCLSDVGSGLGGTL